MDRPAAPLPPSDPSPLVPRSLLCARLAGDATTRLVLVRAPAGFGKTTAMRMARADLDARGVRTAWLTLQRADNHLPRLRQGLATALDGLTGAAGAPCALFLDDVDQITDADALALLRDTLEQLPGSGPRVLGTRALPALGLARWRAQGRLVEVGTEQLRFTPAESAAFFHRRGLHGLSPQALAQLQAKTEGWAAALWLASLGLERHGVHSDFVDRLSGSDRDLADYLAEDVLAQQPPALRAFLLRTSLLHELSLPLCQALLPRSDCAALLAQLEAGSVFLTPLPGSDATAPRWRYHCLFADFLQAHLLQRHADEVPRLHLAAAAWYETAGRASPAIDHALAGGDVPYALTLLARHAEDFLARGRLRRLARWFDAVPEAALAPYPLLQCVAVWAVCFTQGQGPALARLERIAPHSAASPAVQAHAAALRPLLLSMMDRFDDAHACGADALARLPSCRPFADSVLTNTMASVTAALGLSGQAGQLLDAVRRQAGDNAFVRSYTEAVQALLDLQDGRLRLAGERLRGVLGRGSDSARPGDHAWAGVLYAQLLYDAQRLDEADQLLGLYLPMVRDVGLPDHMVLGHALRARIAALRGDADGAFALLTALEVLGHRRQLPRVAASARLERARLLLLQGRGEAARDELDRADDPALWARVQGQRLPAHETEDLAVGRLRWALHFGAADAALAAVDAALTRPASALPPRRWLLLQALRALALQRAGLSDAALDALRPVLAALQAEGSLRLLLDEGPAATALLQRWSARAAQAAQGAGDGVATTALLDHVQRLLDAAGAAPPDLPPPGAGRAATREAPGPADAADAPRTPAEPLTRKEVRILQLLAEGYSNAAMAATLVITDSTVRTHLRAINQKLGAASRAQAVAIARRLALVG